MPFELYRFPGGKKISLSDLLHLSRKHAATISAIKKQVASRKVDLAVGQHDIAPSTFIHRTKDYILDIDDTGQGVLHIVPRAEEPANQYRSQEEKQEDGDIYMPQQEVNFTLVGSNSVGDTVLWAILSYVE
ncbi:MAG TPA: hypothetical protein VEP90_18825 [Methylomirabilota bacterium]|nr:hypothetical protein [Methylomirabilota bacterium]